MHDWKPVQGVHTGITRGRFQYKSPTKRVFELKSCVRAVLTIGTVNACIKYYRINTLQHTHTRTHTHTHYKINKLNFPINCILIKRINVLLLL